VSGDLLPWLLLAAYGAAFWLLSPTSGDAAGFYGGRDESGRSPGTVLLFATVFISWIFAKSVTNAANLGAALGLPGAVAYGAYWLSIPVAGVVIVWIRDRFGVRSLPEWVAGRYGRMAAWGFLLAILIRLYNEVWSNTAVVAAYFGPRGSTAFYAGAAGFTLLTLVYTLKGGLRSSIVTDAVQAGLFTVFLGGVLWFALPESAGDVERVTGSGRWTLSGGVDLLLVAVLQSVSYPFHDPVLTDRGFLSGKRETLRAFLLAGAAGFLAIVLFGLIGLPAFFRDIAVHDDAPRAVAATIGGGVLAFVNVVMLTSAGSTLDSTFSSLAKAVDRDARGVYDLAGASSATGGDLLERIGKPRLGRWVMAAAAVIGNLPLLFGARILQATTISGTMVIGLAPAFVLGAVVKAPPASFHLAFWSGLAVGVAEAAGWIPAAAAVGEGSYATLLGANLWGLVLVTVLFLAPVAVSALRGGGGGRIVGPDAFPSRSRRGPR